MNNLARLAVSSLIALSSACAAPRPASDAWIEIDSSSSALRRWFDAERGHARVLMLLSPT